MANEYETKAQAKRAAAAQRRHANAGGISVGTSLARAADELQVIDRDDPRHAAAWRAVVEWIAVSLECRGYTERQLDLMDFESAAETYIRNRFET